MTVTSEPAGSSETSLPGPHSPEGDTSSVEDNNALEVLANLSASTPRENTSPKNELDAKDRSEIRATRSADALDLQIKLERHRDWLEWQRIKRHLVFVSGLMALSAAFAFGLKYAGIPPVDVAKLIALGFISGLGGYGLRAVTSKIWSAVSARDPSSQSEKSELIYVLIFAVLAGRFVRR